VQAIENFLTDHPGIEFINLGKNVGICKAFNRALRISTGEFIIDLAADDLLLPERVTKGVETFRKLDSSFGVIFSAAEWIDAKGEHLRYHSDKHPHWTIPLGDIYRHLIERYFICSPTMMFRRSVIEKMGGYDETLTYEDFDFWMRSSRSFRYFYDPLVLVKKRKLKNSLSHNQFKIFNRHNYTTYKVCSKILQMNRTATERKALRTRIQYEIRQCLKTLDATLVYRYFLLWIKNNSLKLHD
jgi:glycosyltransferase involved in cell wall biosynthesis